MAVNGCSVLRSAAAFSPQLSAFRLRRCFLHSHYTFRHNGGFKLTSALPRVHPCGWYLGNGSQSLRSYSTQSLINFVMEELAQLRSKKVTRATSRIGILSSKVAEDKPEKLILKEGLLLEFRKDSDRILLAVAVKPDGKKNWMVCDQNGVTSSIKPQQITYVVPGVEDFDHAQISDFVQRAQSLLDPSIVEYAWIELLEKKGTVTADGLAEILYGSVEPLGSYCAHVLLSNDEIYFAVVESKGSYSVYQPRSCDQVQELLKRKHVKEESKKELEELIQLLRSAKALPLHSKASKCSWTVEEKIRSRISALEAYALDVCKSDEQKKIAGVILQAMGMTKTSSAAMNLLIDIGYFPVHVNLDILKLNICTEYSKEVLVAAENLFSTSFDVDEKNRKDLTFLKVYAIDVDEADEIWDVIEGDFHRKFRRNILEIWEGIKMMEFCRETCRNLVQLDDALSAMRLEDGRIKVWIHVADPASLVQPQSILDREAMRRGTSIFLPTATYPMFPLKLAMERMSLQQGKLCNAVSISVTLYPNGSIAEYTVDNSIIRPTYMLTYESATELLHLNLEEEPELRILSEAASLRLQWRLQQGGVDTSMISPRVRVQNPDDPEPTINLYVENQADLAMRLVTEMMLLCGEAVATFGSQNNIPLPYRGQPQSNISISSFAHLPEGHVRNSACVKTLRAAEMDFRKPIRHGVLGLPGYVQFSSPIRRYTDMLAHYQVKAFLRGDSLPFSAGQLEGISSLVNMQARLIKRLCNNSLRYWLLEFLRRQPKEKKFQALILRFIKDRMADLLLLEVGIQASVSLSLGKQIGDQIDVKVEESHPRDDILILKEA